MTQKQRHFQPQPGAILHAAIAGALKARGSGFEIWCHEHDIPPSTVRNCTYGQSKGPKGQAMIGRLVADAGPDLVRALYIHRLKAHLADVEKAAS